MSRSNNNKPFYVDVGTSIVAVRCASNHDVIVEYDFGLYQTIVQYAKEVCDRMNKEAENGRPLRNCDVGTAEEQLERHDKFGRGASNSFFILHLLSHRTSATNDRNS